MAAFRLAVKLWLLLQKFGLAAKIWQLAAEWSLIFMFRVNLFFPTAVDGGRVGCYASVAGVCEPAA